MRVTAPLTLSAITLCQQRSDEVSQAHGDIAINQTFNVVDCYSVDLTLSITFVWSDEQVRYLTLVGGGGDGGGSIVKDGG